MTYYTDKKEGDIIGASYKKLLSDGVMKLIVIV